MHICQNGKFQINLRKKKKEKIQLFNWDIFFDFEKLAFWEYAVFESGNYLTVGRSLRN